MLEPPESAQLAGGASGDRAHSQRLQVIKTPSRLPHRLLGCVCVNESSREKNCLES